MRIQSPNQLSYNKSCSSFSQQKIGLTYAKITIGGYHYSEDSLIGKGFSSKVYKAIKDNQPLVQYAIKVIDTAKFKQSSIDLLNSEIEIHQSLNHRNIVQCKDVIRKDGYCYIITEYCKQGDLMNYLKRTSIQQKQVIQIMMQIIQGYKYLISVGVIHRDLKPANIFKSENTWKIGDFGFSKRSNQWFIDKINVGTPLYMPLESLTKNKYSYKSDVFALGVMAYQIYFKRTPWECTSQKQLVKKMSQIKLQIPSTVKSEILREFMIRCCDVNQNKRIDRQQFTKLQFCTYQSNPEELCKSIKDIKLINEIKVKNAKNTKQSLKTGFSESRDSLKIGDKQDKTQVTKLNSQILVKQLKYCRFMYYIIQNMSYILVPDGYIKNLKMVLFKHILKTVKNLQNKNKNLFHLSNWQIYKNTDIYIKLAKQFNSYALRYEKQYHEYLKFIDAQTIRISNKNFNQLAHQNTQLNLNFYQNFAKFIKHLLKIHNHQLGKLNNQNNNENQLGGYIEALNNLHELWMINQQIVTTLCSSGNKSGFHSNSINSIKLKYKLKVQINYKDSILNIQDYLKIRAKISSI